MKNNKKIKIPSYAFGLQGFSTFLNNNPQAINAGAQMLPQLTSAIGLNEDTSTVLNDTASMAAMGSTFGPIGTGAGALLGFGKGLLGVNANKKRRQAERSRKNRIENTNALAKLNNQSNEMAYDYFQDNEIIPTFNNGGIMLNNLAFLDNNEIVRTPDGQVSTVYGDPNKTDDVLTVLPEGSGILSDNIKIPGSKKTFAEAGSKVEKLFNKGKSNTGFYAKQTKDLNNVNMNKMIDDLLSVQENVKNKKGIKPTSKNIVPSYVNGLQGKGGLGRRIVGSGSSSNINNPNIPQTASVASIYDPNRYLPNVNSTLMTRPIVSNRFNTSLNNPIEENTDIQNPSINSNKIMDVATNFLSLAPTMYNLRKSNETPEVQRAVNNPYSSLISSTMARRRFDVNPLLDRNREITSVTNYNANSITNSGQNMAYRLAGIAGQRQADANAYSQASNINNSYSADYANVLNNLGQQSVSATIQSDDINRRNRAASENYRGEAYSQLSEWAQNRQSMNNKASNDNKRLQIWKMLAKYGLKESDLNNITNIINN